MVLKALLNWQEKGYHFLMILLALPGRNAKDIKDMHKKVIIRSQQEGVKGLLKGNQFCRTIAFP